MKKLLAAVITAIVVCFLPATSLAQGTVNFSNFASGLDSKVYLDFVGSSSLPAGSTYTVELLVVADGALDSSATFVVSSIFDVGSDAGYFFAGTKSVAGFSAGTTVDFFVRAYLTSAGSYANAVNTGQYAGTSSRIQNIKLGGGSNPLPNLNGLTSFALTTAAVPEPSTFALAALGGLGLLWRRRRA